MCARVYIFRSTDEHKSRFLTLPHHTRSFNPIYTRGLGDNMFKSRKREKKSNSRNKIIRGDGVGIDQTTATIRPVTRRSFNTRRSRRTGRIRRRRQRDDRESQLNYKAHNDHTAIVLFYFIAHTVQSTTIILLYSLYMYIYIYMYVLYI